MERFYILFALLYILAYLGAWYLIFKKAHYPGWYAFVPFFNFYIMLKMVNLSGFFIFLFFIPLVNIAATAWYSYKLADFFGKGNFYTLGLFFLHPIFIIMLGFGDAQYLKSKSNS